VGLDPLADDMLAEHRAFEEFYRFRNADHESYLKKLEAWTRAAEQRRLTA
jgi:hypothetical protein